MKIIVLAWHLEHGVLGDEDIRCLEQSLDDQTMKLEPLYGLDGYTHRVRWANGDHALMIVKQVEQESK